MFYGYAWAPWWWHLSQAVGLRGGSGLSRSFLPGSAPYGQQILSAPGAQGIYGHDRRVGQGRGALLAPALSPGRTTPQAGPAGPAVSWGYRDYPRIDGQRSTDRPPPPPFAPAVEEAWWWGRTSQQYTVCVYIPPSASTTHTGFDWCDAQVFPSLFTALARVKELMGAPPFVYPGTVPPGLTITIYEKQSGAAVQKWKSGQGYWVPA
jgi:hypothetical protein